MMDWNTYVEYTKNMLILIGIVFVVSFVVSYIYLKYQDMDNETKQSFLVITIVICICVLILFYAWYMQTYFPELIDDTNITGVLDRLIV